MSKLLRPGDRILLGLSLVSDAFDEIRLAGGIVPKEYELVYGFVPEKYKKDNLYSVVGKMLNAGQIEKEIINGEVVFKITSAGKGKITRKFPLIKLQNKKWDGKWRIVSYDIPEKLHWRRDALRKKLEELGFGMIHESVWISPHPFEEDIREFLMGSSLGEYTYVFVAQNYFSENTSDLVEKLWKIGELEDKYDDLLIDYGKISKNEWIEKYFGIIATDPFLPKSMLPNDWSGFKAQNLAKKCTFK